MSRMTKEQVEDLLHYIDVDKIQEWKGNKIQFCCPIHGESHPSCGINIDYTPKNENGSIQSHLQVFNCFSCGASGNLAWFLYQAMPEKFKSYTQAEDFMKNRYGVDFSEFDLKDLQDHSIVRYGDCVEVQEERFTMPKAKLAIFRSGKETYKYFFDRGFDKADMQEYMIGRDLDSKTVTIPAFYEDGVLAGIIGRYINPNRPKNMRYKVYGFPKNDLIYPADKLEVVNDTIIGVESMFDVMHLRKWGYPNAIALMGMEMSDIQADYISKRAKKFIAMFDNDDGGRKAISKAKNKLKKRGVIVLTCDYPETGKDVEDWGEMNCVKMIQNAKQYDSLPRL